QSARDHDPARQPAGPVAHHMPDIGAVWARRPGDAGRPASRDCRRHPGLTPGAHRALRAFVDDGEARRGQRGDARVADRDMSRQHLSGIALLVRDYDEAKAYYTGVLGFTLVEDTDMGGGKRWLVVAPPGARETHLVLAQAATPAQE